MDDSALRNGRSVGPTEIDWEELDKSNFLVVGAGLFAGVMEVLLHPISVVETRLEVASHGATERNGFSVVKGLLKGQGVRGLCKGLGTTAVRGSITARILFRFALERVQVSAFKMVRPLRLSEPPQAATANGHFDALWFPRMVVVPLQLHCGGSGDQRLFSHRISGVLSTGGLTETFKTWLANPVPLSIDSRSFSKKSRANGRKATSKPKSQRKQARHNSFTCFHCGKKFDSPKANAGHYKFEHPDILSKKPLFECTCGNFSNNKEDYNGHYCPRPPGQTAKESDEILIQKMKERKKENEQMKKQKGGKKKKKK